MRLSTLARSLLAFGLAGLGVLSLRYDDFALNWQPVPDGIPLRPLVAYASGALLLLGGLGLLWPRTRLRAAQLNAWFIASWLLFLQVPRVVKAPGDIGTWLGFGETLLFATGAWTLAIALNPKAAGKPDGLLTSPAAKRVARLLFGVALVLIGPSHFKYDTFTAQMIPSWIPGHMTLAHLTGAGHIAAGVAIVLGLVPRLAATMEAGMIGAFVLLLHAPALIAAPTDRMSWTIFCIAVAYDGAAWAIAASLADAPWLRLPGTPKTVPAAA